MYVLIESGWHHSGCGRHFGYDVEEDEVTSS